MRINYLSSLYLKALTGFAALALGSLASAGGKSLAGNHDLPLDAQSVQSTSRIITVVANEIGNAELRKSAEAVEKHLSGSGRLLTIRQKRFFVLGIGASEKK